MLLLRAENLKKIYGNRVALEVEELSVYEGDKIGVVGANGAGKTTLFELLAEEAEPEEGRIGRYGEISYCRQFQKTEDTKEAIYGKSFRLWQVPKREDASRVSGGEEMRKKLAQVFEGSGHILLLDEPTANLDREGIGQLIGELKKVETFLCISHDRELLSEVCTQILEVDGGKIKLYEGNYRDYERQKREEKQRAAQEYDAYRKEKERLEAVYQKKRQSAEKMVKIPKNMTPREAHLRDFLTMSGRNSSGKQKSMNRAADNIKKRIDHMEAKEKPRQETAMHLNFSRTNPPESKKILEGKELSFSYGEQVIFEGASFTLANRKKTALLGPNGSGKTTLLRLIEKAGEEEVAGMRIVPKAKPGILKQDFSQLNPEKTVLENAMEDSVQDPWVVKNVLAGLLFTADDWSKKAAVLSGGEKMKLAFAKLLVSEANVLFLDEPTNYLDLPSIRALEKQLQEYEGAVLFVSHDQEFVRQTAQELLLIEDRRILKFAGSLDAYEREKERETKRQKEDKKTRLAKEERMRLELKLARLTGQLGHAPSLEEKEKMEAEYWEIAKRLREGEK